MLQRDNFFIYSPILNDKKKCFDNQEKFVLIIVNEGWTIKVDNLYLWLQLMVPVSDLIVQNIIVGPDGVGNKLSKSLILEGLNEK